MAFVFGYALTLGPVLRAGLGLRAATGVTLAADTVSIAVMELVDNAVILAVSGAMDAGLAKPGIMCGLRRHGQARRNVLRRCLRPWMRRRAVEQSVGVGMPPPPTL